MELGRGAPRSPGPALPVGLAGLCVNTASLWLSTSPPTPQSTFYASPFTVRLLAQETGLPHLPRASTNFY